MNTFVTKVQILHQNWRLMPEFWTKIKEVCQRAVLSDQGFPQVGEKMKNSEKPCILENVLPAFAKSITSSNVPSKLASDATIMDKNEESMSKSSVARSRFSPSWGKIEQ